MPTHTQPSSDPNHRVADGAVDCHGHVGDAEHAEHADHAEHASDNGIVDTEIAILGAGFAGMC
ncbi:MAG: hypothetical protein WCR23_13720, partial [Planctomycetota bacterium]